MQKGEETLKRAKKYFHENGLMLNTTKTQCMFVGSRGLLSMLPSDLCLNVDDTQIHPCKSLKNLGIIFDCNMTFDAHVTNINRKIFSTILYINRIKDHFTKSARITIIQSVVLSIINYGIKIWGSTSKTNMIKMQKLQNFAAKAALGGGARRDHATPFIRDLRWLKMHQRYKYEMCQMVFNIVKKNRFTTLFSLQSVNEISPVQTRQQQQLYVPSYKTNTGERSFLISGPKLWNSLPKRVKDTQSLQSFKKDLFYHLFKDQF